MGLIERGMRMARGRFLAIALAAAGVFLLPPGLPAQDRYPARPIRLVVASAAGGVHDVIGRLWANKLKAALGTIVIDNRGGAGGTIGVGEVARAQPDGYTLLLGSNSTHILHPLIARQPIYDAIRDFEVASIFAVTASSVAVHPAAPARTLEELIAHAKANPGKLSYAHAGVGSVSHVASEMFKQLAGGLDIFPVPYKGMGPAQADVISGNVADVPAEHHRPGDRAAPHRENPHPCGQRPGPPPGAGGDSDRGRSRRHRHDRAEFLRHFRPGRHAEGDHRPTERRNSGRAGRQGLRRDAEPRRVRADERIRPRQGEDLHQGRIRAVEAVVKAAGIKE